MSSGFEVLLPPRFNIYLVWVQFSDAEKITPVKPQKL